jgi:hypothetical protein
MSILLAGDQGAVRSIEIGIALTNDTHGLPVKAQGETTQEVEVILVLQDQEAQENDLTLPTPKTSNVVAAVAVIVKIAIKSKDGPTRQKIDKRKK